MPEGLARTPLYEEHIALGARMVTFAGFEMPVQYAGIIEEHRAVRDSAGVFDICHMAEFRVNGFGAFDALQRLVTNDLHRTDELGRDILARIVYGARVSLLIGFSAIIVSLMVGLVLGGTAGYYGGKIDSLIMRGMDVFLCLPDVLLALAIIAAFGNTKVNLTIAIGLAFSPKFSRVVRSAVMGVRDNEYIEAARSIGARDYRIISRHVLPNCIGPIIVQVTLYVANAILTIAALSFIGLGLQPPTPEWGNMLASGRTFMRDFPHIVLAPGLAIFFTILALNLLGDGLRDTLDPRLKH